MKLDGSWKQPIHAPFDLATNDAYIFYQKLHAWSHIPFEDPLSAGCPEPSPFFINNSMIAALPFMAMDLGFNDMFVLVRYFSELGIDFITDKKAQS